MISVVIPVFNEEKSISSTVGRVRKALSAGKVQHEVIVVDDGSSDGSPSVLSGIPGIRVITHPYNLGYGAALKSGIRNAKGEWVLIVDADGTYPVESIPALLEHRDRYDMVVGARSGKNVPLLRRPAKAVIGLLANTLTGRNIPDLNSGFRVFRRDVALQFMHLYPQGFSFTITITLACLTSGYTVKYVPIEYAKREGRSSISPIRDFVGFLTLVVRIIMYFEPLKFFLLPSLLLMLLGLASGIYEYAVIRNIAELPVILLLAGLQIGLLGLLADVMAKRNRA